MTEEYFGARSEAGQPLRGCVLLDAHSVINGERQDAYGAPEDNFAIIADLWNNYLGNALTKFITPMDVAMMMTLLKIARIRSGTATRDSFVDAAGYIALASEIG